MKTLKQLVLTSTAAALMTAPALAQPTYNFAPFDALNGEGKDCVVTFDPQTLDVCGKTLAVSDVRGWTWGLGPGMGGEQPYLFTIYGQDLDVTQVKFLNRPTARRFEVQLGVWSGKDAVSPGSGLFWK